MISISQSERILFFFINTNYRKKCIVLGTSATSDCQVQYREVRLIYFTKLLILHVCTCIYSHGLKFYHSTLLNWTELFFVYKDLAISDKLKVDLTEWRNDKWYAKLENEQNGWIVWQALSYPSKTLYDILPDLRDA